MKHGFLCGFGDYKSKLLLLAERGCPTLASTLVTNGQYNYSLPLINTHPATANTEFENEQLHTERDCTISCGVGQEPVNEPRSPVRRGSLWAPPPEECFQEVQRMSVSRGASGSTELNWYLQAGNFPSCKQPAAL